jgi:hypothetical protein
MTTALEYIQVRQSWGASTGTFIKFHEDGLLHK